MPSTVIEKSTNHLNCYMKLVVTSSDQGNRSYMQVVAGSLTKPAVVKWCLHQWQYCSGFFSAFCPRRGGKMILYELLEGQVHISVQNMWQTRGVQGRAPPGNDFWIFYQTHFGGIWDCFCTNITYHVSIIEAFILDLHVKQNSQHIQGGS